MALCWNLNPSLRPSFSDLVTAFEQELHKKGVSCCWYILFIAGMCDVSYIFFLELVILQSVNQGDYIEWKH